MDEKPELNQGALDLATPLSGVTVSPEVSVAKAPGMNYVLVAKFTEKTWLSVQIDQEKKNSFIYHPGDHAVWQAREKISLFVGNAGGISMTLNGKPVPSLGESMKSVRISFPAQ